MLNKFIDTLSNNPLAGVKLTSGSFIGGLLLELTPETMEIITFVLQSGAFLSTIVLAVLTAISLKRRNERDKRKNDNKGT